MTPLKAGTRNLSSLRQEGNDYRAPQERNINSHGFQPVERKRKNENTFWCDFRWRSRKS